MTTMTSRGQVTIPKRMREALGLKPGSKVVFEYQGNGKAVIQAPAKPASPDIAKMRGLLKTDQSTDEIMAILRGDD
jgi:AbrB family looped-hinge helix DNA binding protein